MNGQCSRCVFWAFSPAAGGLRCFINGSSSPSPAACRWFMGRSGVLNHLLRARVGVVR